MMRKIILFNSILTLLLSFPVYSQQRPQIQIPDSAGIVMGSLVDAGMQPIPYATIHIRSLPDSLSQGMTISDEDGRFSFNPIHYGLYYIDINAMGYKNHLTKPFTISKENPMHRMPRYKLEERSEMLESVTVTAQKNMLTTNLDKKVFNVDANISADGATAVEVLQDIPSVDVDLEGNVTLRGSENVTILVDGRPTNLTLEQIPAAQIESIEVITNPSARLEPDGMAGILNVVLKKKKESGFTGMVSLGSGMTIFQNKAYFENYNGNVNLNYTYNKITLYLNYNFRTNGRHSAGTMERTSWFNTIDTSYLFQENSSDNSGMSHSLRTGLDWFINKQNTLAFSFGYNNSNRNSSSETSSDNARVRYGEYFPYMTYDQLSKSDNGNNHFNANINYKKEFNVKGMELVADLYYTQMQGNNINRMSQFYTIPDSTPNYFQRTENITSNRNATAQIDFVSPVGNGGRIEAGYKFSLRMNGQDYSLFDGHREESLVIDSLQINDFLYTEYINAAYLIYSNTFW
ncbi:outer membrane beta-barrel protein, partial [Bacteroidales bacterium OttesenSCG-928-A14]|nr:outer membrane beta-barrel protein [Bacteroidales bacterium OttesenSCG-928-A14]